MDHLYSDDEIVGGEMRPIGSWMHKGGFKVVALPEPYGDGEWRLFDVENVPSEAQILADERPELLSELLEAYGASAAEVDVPPADQN